MTLQLSILEFRTARNVLGAEHDGDFFAGCRAFSTSWLPDGFGSAAYRAGYQWQRADYLRQIDPDGADYRAACAVLKGAG